MTQTCVRQSDLGTTKHTPMVSHPLALLNLTINTTFSCGKCEKLMVVQQLVPGTKTSSFTLPLRNFCNITTNCSLTLRQTFHILGVDPCNIPILSRLQKFYNFYPTAPSLQHGPAKFELGIKNSCDGCSTCSSNWQRLQFYLWILSFLFYPFQNYNHKMFVSNTNNMDGTNT